MSQFLHPSVRSVRSLLLILCLKLLRLPQLAGLNLPHKWGPKNRRECLPRCVVLLRGMLKSAFLRLYPLGVLRCSVLAFETSAFKINLFAI